jgi:hypothetical protein
MDLGAALTEPQRPSASTPTLKPNECNHLKGVWERRGAFAVMNCVNGDYQIIIEVDSPEAFNLFEGGSGAIQRFGKDLKCATPEDEERLQEWFARGQEHPSFKLDASISALASQEQDRVAFKGRLETIRDTAYRLDPSSPFAKDGLMLIQRLANISLHEIGDSAEKPAESNAK